MAASEELQWVAPKSSKADDFWNLVHEATYNRVTRQALIETATEAILELMQEKLVLLESNKTLTEFSLSLLKEHE